MIQTLRLLVIAYALCGKTNGLLSNASNKFENSQVWTLSRQVRRNGVNFITVRNLPHFGSVENRLFGTKLDDNTEEQVQIGSKEYYEGFVRRDLNQESSERVTGDAILGPTIKFVGGFATAIVVLLLAFLKSNSLI